MNEMIKPLDFTKLIKTKTDWQPLVDAVGRANKRYTDLVEQYGAHGVYQIIHKNNLTNNLIDANIGYIGKSTNIFDRVYSIKIGKHNCCNYMRHNNYGREDVCVRYLFTEIGSEGTLEDAIHAEMTKQFGYRFAWREASAGNDGAMLRIYEAIDKIENLEDLKNLSKHIDDKAILLFMDTWKG